MHQPSAIASHGISNRLAKHPTDKAASNLMVYARATEVWLITASQATFRRLQVL